MKNKPTKGVVEQVRTGTTLRVLLPNSFDSIQLLLAVRHACTFFSLKCQGIRSPSISGNDESTAEPYAREAKFITEHLLLHRDVTVTIEVRCRSIYMPLYDLRYIGH